MFFLEKLFAILTAIHVPGTICAPNLDPVITTIARDYPECVDEIGTDGLAGMDATELRDACTEW